MARHLAFVSAPLLVILLAFGLFGAGRSVRASTAATPAFGMKPEPQADPAVTASNYFIFKAVPGGRPSGQVRLSNPTSHAVTVDLDAVDALTAANGGSAFALNGVAPSAVGAWIAVKKTEITVKPGQERLVSFTVAVPKDAKPGQYLAGLSATEAPPASASPTVGARPAGAAIDVRTRYVVAVEIDVPGQWTPSLRVAGVSLLNQPSGQFLGIALINDGAAFLRPSGTITVTDASGKAALTETIAMGTFVTGTSIVYPVAWPKSLAPGRYHVSVEFAYGAGLTATGAGDVTTVG